MRVGVLSRFGANSPWRTIFAAATGARTETHGTLAALGAEFLPIDIELLEGRVPIPPLGFHEVHNEEVFQLFQLGETATVR